MELDLRHHPPCRLPAGRLVEKAFESKHRLVAWPSHWPRQQLPNVPPQNVVGRKPNRVPHLPLFQGLVELRLGEGRVGARKTTSLPCRCWRSISGSSSSSQLSALWTLPRRSFAARQSPSRLNSSSG